MSVCAKFQLSSSSRSAWKVSVVGWGLQSHFHVIPNHCVEVRLGFWQLISGLPIKYFGRVGGDLYPAYHRDMGARIPWYIWLNYRCNGLVSFWYSKELSYLKALGKVVAVNLRNVWEECTARRKRAAGNLIQQTSHWPFNSLIGESLSKCLSCCTSFPVH